MEFEINWKFSFKLIFKFKLDMKVKFNFEMRIVYKNSGDQWCLTASNAQLWSYVMTEAVARRRSV